jgi:hypothetical protein
LAFPEKVEEEDFPPPASVPELVSFFELDESVSFEEESPPPEEGFDVDEDESSAGAASPEL